MRYLLSVKMVIICCLSSILATAQNVGIGTNTPLQKLHIFNGSSGVLGTFPPLAVETSGNTYLNLLAPQNSETGVLFGRGTDAASGGIVYNNSGLLNGFQFRTGGNVTRLVLTGNGFLGIGNSNPGFILDVGGRTRFRRGGTNETSAGFWLNNNSQSTVAFVGMENDNYVGLFGTGAGWRFSMNVATGALKINGSEGSTGQVLSSNGSSAPSWKSASNQLYNNTIEILPGFGATLSQSTPNKEIGMEYSFTLTGNSKVLVFVTINCFTDACVFCSSPLAKIGLYLNDSHQSTFYGTVPNGVLNETIGGTKYMNLGAGSYTLKLKGSVEGPNVIVSTVSTSMVVQIIPQ